MSVNQLLEKGVQGEQLSLVESAILENSHKINDLIMALKLVNEELSEVKERLDVIEEILDHDDEPDGEFNEVEESDNLPDSSRVIQQDPVQIVESEDDKSPASVRLDWRRHSESRAILDSKNKPEPGVKYTDLEYQEFVKAGYDLKMGFKWIKWMTDDDHWWELSKKLVY